MHKKGTKVVGVSCHPVDSDIFLTCGNDHKVRISADENCSNEAQILQYCSLKSMGKPMYNVACMQILTVRFIWGFF